MDIEIIIQSILAQAVAKFPISAMILGVLGLLVVVAQVVVGLTPGKTDDEVLAKLKGVPVLGALLKVLATFAPKWPGAGA